MSLLYHTRRRSPAHILFALAGLRNRSRLLSSSSVVDLKYDVYDEVRNSASNGPLIILHGLFGSKRNWQSLSKAFAKQVQRPVYALDLRNHGESPHKEPMDYATMALDVLHFCREHSLENISLLGHSMGGKVAMSVALNPELPRGLLSHLIVADISPIRGRISKEFERYMDGMKSIEQEGVYKRKDAFELLSAYEEDVMVRQFLMTNLAHTLSGESLKFRIPLDILNRAIPNVGWFPYEPGESSWDGPTLFIRGTKSNYIQLKNLGVMKQFFPQMQLEELEGNHWIHVEQPSDFVKTVSNFVMRP